MTNNPMDGYMDIKPYKWAWGADIHPAVLCVLDDLNDVHPSFSAENYENHWRRSGPHDPAYNAWVLDIYGPNAPWPRSQMPKALGDQIAAWFLANHRPRMLNLIWFKRHWTKTSGPLNWTAAQGQFVDHIHIEWDHVHLNTWAIANC